MAKGPPNVPVEGFVERIQQNWHDECCAEHDGTIGSFSTLDVRLTELGNYEELFHSDTWNWAKGGKIAVCMIGGSALFAPLSLLAAPGIAAALGGAGILGPASTGTAISSLSGAALTNASLAAIGGGAIGAGGAGMAGGTILITAVGGALGGVRGGVIANGYFGQVKDFSIRKFSHGRSPNLLMINGFLQQKNEQFEDWLEHTQVVFSGYRQYGVNWESKTLRNLGASLLNASYQNAFSFMRRVLARSSRTTAQKINPLNWGDVIASLISNPWHNAMVKAGMTGVLVADILSRVQRQRNTLMGHSLGARVVFYALTNLAMKKQKPIKDVFLFGGAVDRRSDSEWINATKSVSGRIYNCYSKNDKVLRWLYRGSNALLSDPIGYGPITARHPKIVNVDCSELVSGHMGYKVQLSAILEKIGYPARKS